MSNPEYNEPKQGNKFKEGNDGRNGSKKDYEKTRK